VLLDPWENPQIGSLKNRVVMSAMTRSFADPEHRATPAMAEYYARRAADGVALILTEGTIVHPTGDGFNNVPYICTAEHAASWRQAVDAVHAAGSRFFCQLWHCGRISHEDFTGGVQPISSSSRRAEGTNRQNGKPYAVPRPLEISEMPGIYDQFRRAAAFAMDAGFDGVELHLAHGYLADQFFDSRVNDRTDAYGGSVANRCRFGLELTQAVLADLGPRRVMVRISPSRDMNGPYDWPELEEMLAYVIPAFDSIGLRMLDISCARADYYQTSGRIIRKVRPHWPHFLIGGASLTPEQAEAELTSGLLDMITWGRFLLANPDFISKLRQGRPLVPMESAMLKVLF
jgi:2,4-dienoyl-CoA reductase-like NADH-dependent reductase (Old Yellow Enzyme family)